MATPDHDRGPTGTGPVRGRDASDPAPANEVEERLRAVAEAGDLAAVLGTLATAPLYLPGFRDHATGAPAQRQRLLTRARDGVPYLPVFTSPEALHRAVEADGWRETDLAELARGTPAGWGLAINPGSPIGVLVPPADLSALVPRRDELATFAPANELERTLRDALGSLAGETLLDLLVTARVIVPTRPVAADGVPMVPVFTSAARRDDFLAGRDADLPTVTVDLVAVLRAWPGPDCRLAVNPGSPIAFAVSGIRVPGLLAYAVQLARRHGVPEPAAPAPPDEVVPPPRPSGGDIAGLLRGDGAAAGGEGVPPGTD